jgi:hypothetical protein
MGKKCFICGAKEIFFEIPSNIQLREKLIEAIYKVCGNYVVIYLTIKTLIRD